MSPRAKRHSRQRVRAAVDDKAPGEYRSGREEIYWIVLEGRRRSKVRLPKGDGGWGIGFQESVRKDLLLSHGQFDDFVDCTLTGPHYEELLLEKLSQGLI
jgi:hypothetical protein